jgi:restriction endonuclease Mrr
VVCEGCGYGIGVERKSDALWVNALWGVFGKPQEVWKQESIRNIDEQRIRERAFDEFCRQIPLVRIQREREKQEELLKQQEQKRREAVERERRKQVSRTQVGLQRMTPTAFELVVGSLYQALGYTVYVTPGSGDRGIDLAMVKDGLQVAVQCKRYSRAVGEPTVREFYGSFIGFFSQGIFVTTSHFSRAASAWASERKDLTLVDIDLLVKMLCDTNPDLKDEFPMRAG